MSSCGMDYRNRKQEHERTGLMFDLVFQTIVQAQIATSHTLDLVVDNRKNPSLDKISISGVADNPNADCTNELCQPNPGISQTTMNGLEVTVWLVLWFEDHWLWHAVVDRGHHTHLKVYDATALHDEICLQTNARPAESAIILDQGEQANESISLTFNVIKRLHGAEDQLSLILDLFQSIHCSLAHF